LVDKNALAWIWNIWIDNVLELHLLQRRTLDHDGDLIVILEEVSLGGLREHCESVVELGWLNSEDNFVCVLVLERQVVGVKLIDAETLVLIGSKLNSKLLEFAHLVVDRSVRELLRLASDQIDSLNGNVGLLDIDETVSIALIITEDLDAHVGGTSDALDIVRVGDGDGVVVLTWDELSPKVSMIFSDDLWILGGRDCRWVDRELSESVLLFSNKLDAILVTVVTGE